MTNEEPRFYEFEKHGSVKVYSDKTCNVIYAKGKGGRGQGIIVSESDIQRVRADKDNAKKIILELLDGEHYLAGGNTYLAAIIDKKPIIAGPLRNPDDNGREIGSGLFNCIEEEIGETLSDSEINLKALQNLDGKSPTDK
jgi:hypothetical protein|tara:strand:- start:237 stop:656 length:420 start_codon:yes stop_codon:yes gene_type:complete